MKLSALIIVSFLFLGSCFAVDTKDVGADPISHSIWNDLLKKHVDATGYVDYGGFKRDQAKLKEYLKLVSENPPSKNWSVNERLAYWINAYNAFTVQLILDHADENIKSIKDIGSTIKIPFVNTPWDVKFIKIGGDAMDLNNIEHGIIRKRFAEPRIHFALVCAARSCPPLRNEAYVASKLSSQLDDQGRKFINDPKKNQVSANQAKLSKIFNWYGGDFKKTDTIINWVNKYAKTKASAGASISYLDYNWALNGKL